jgi:hypothetical protein
MTYKVKIKDDFKNLLDYQAWLNSSIDKMSALNQSELTRFKKPMIDKLILKLPQWFGKAATYEILAEGVKEFQNPELLDNVYSEVSYALSPIITQKLKAKQLKFNALGLGLFSFDRAAMTLYKITENRTTEQNGKQTKTQIEPQIKTQTKTQIKTNTKDLFAYFPEVKKDKHAIEFFISADAAGDITAEQMLYNGVSAVIMAELIIKAGIPLKINIVIGSALDKFRNSYLGCVVPVKNYDEPLDRNVVALLSSDPRFMRFDAFKGLICAFESFNLPTPAGLGFAMNAEQLKTVFENSDYIKKLPSAHRYYFGGTFSQSQALEKINDTIGDIAQLLASD